MSRDARAFWTVAPGRGEIRAETLPAAATTDVVVRTLFSGVSRGSESLVFHGGVPTEEYQRMRAPFQAGDFPGPLKYGYASVGRVESGPADLAGRTVFCLFPHQTAYVVPATAVHVVPDDVPAARAVLAANMETALNGVWDARVLPGDRVTVVGGGTVGCLVAWLAGQIPGCDVQLVDISADRAGIAQHLGVSFAQPADAARARDVVIHASGAPAGLDTALALADFEATVVELSWYGDRAVTASLGKAFHRSRTRRAHHERVCVRRLARRDAVAHERHQPGPVSPRAVSCRQRPSGLNPRRLPARVTSTCTACSFAATS